MLASKPRGMLKFRTPCEGRYEAELTVSERAERVGSHTTLLEAVRWTASPRDKLKVSLPEFLSWEEHTDSQGSKAQRAPEAEWVGAIHR